MNGNIYEYTHELITDGRMYPFSYSERIKATDQKFTQLRDIYQKLRNEHIMLLRSSGENQRKLTNAEKHLLEEETARLVRLCVCVCVCVCVSV